MAFCRRLSIFPKGTPPHSIQKTKQCAASNQRPGHEATKSLFLWKIGNRKKRGEDWGLHRSLKVRNSEITEESHKINKIHGSVALLFPFITISTLLILGGNPTQIRSHAASTFWRCP
jgi:hypothetical protein